MNSQEFIDLEDQYGAHNYHPLEVVIDHAERVWVYDVEGNKYLDCLSAYSALNQGHCHPRLIKVMTEQAQKVTLTSRAFYNNKLPLFYQTLCDMTGYPMALAMNSGAEAVETALKVARKWGYYDKKVEPNKAEIIVCSGNFHGRTIAIVGFSTEAQYKDGYGPYPAGFVTVPYGDAKALEAAITPNTVAFLIEPIQGEAGVVVPPAGYLKRAAEICHKNNVLFMADEIQTGLGRTGSLFASDHEGVKPDVVILGKALGGGFYPVSVVLSSKEVLGQFKPGDHGSTFGGNPLGAAIAVEALNIIKDEHLIENARDLGTYFQERLAEIPSPHVKDVRGKGLLIGVELNTPARRFCEALRERGILCKETHSTVIRFAPPLIITKDEIDWAIERITEVLNMA